MHERGGCDAAAAAQLVKAARPGDRAALAALDEVAAELVARSPAVAAELALHALDLTGSADEQQVPRAATAAEALVAAGRVRAATELAERTLALARGPGPAADRLASYWLRSGCSTASRRQSRPCSAKPGPPTKPGLPTKPGRHPNEAPPARPRPARPGPPATAGWPAERWLTGEGRGGAELVRAVALLAGGDLGAAEASADAALAGVSGAGPPGVGLATLAWVAWRRGHLTTALDLGRAAVVRSARGEPPGRLAELELAAMLLAAGELDEAAEVLDRAGAPAGPLDALWEPVALQLGARLQLGDRPAGRGGRQLPPGARARRGARHPGGGPAGPATLAQVAVLRGNLEQAARHAELDGPGPALLPTDPAALAWSRAQLDAGQAGRRPRCCGADRRLGLAAGRVGGAGRSRADPGGAGGRRSRAGAGAGLARRAGVRRQRRPGLAAGVRRPRPRPRRGRRRALDRAAAGHRRPWSVASAHEDAGVVLVGAGDRAAARDRFERALGCYRQAGAERDAARVRARLRELGVRACHWSRADHPDWGWASLTEAERRVAAAVAEGLTNRQAAERLFLSRHTVDFHLRQIFLKLGIRSRVELTRLVVQEPGPGQTT